MRHMSAASSSTLGTALMAAILAGCGSAAAQMLDAAKAIAQAVLAH